MAHGALFWLRFGLITFIFICDAPGFPLRCHARIRYRQPLQWCTLDDRRQSGEESAGIRVTFDEPQRAVAPGQSIMFYDNDGILGGVIE